MHWTADGKRVTDPALEQLGEAARNDRRNAVCCDCGTQAAGDNDWSFHLVEIRFPLDPRRTEHVYSCDPCYQRWIKTGHVAA